VCCVCVLKLVLLLSSLWLVLCTAMALNRYTYGDLGLWQDLCDFSRLVRR